MTARDLSISMISSHISSMRAQILPYNQTVEQCDRELSELLNSHDASARHVNSRIADISDRILKLKNNAMMHLGFVPEKLSLFCQSYDPFFQDWNWMMHDDGFQNPFQRFFSEVNRLSSRTDLTRGDYGRLKFCFSQLPEEEKLAVLHYFNPLSDPASCSDASLSEGELCSILTDEKRFDEILPARIEVFLGRLRSEYLPLKTSLLGLDDLDFLKHDVEKRARAQGVVIEDWDLDWRHHHLYDSPERLVSALSQLTLMRRNEMLFSLWKSLRQVGSGPAASRLLLQCPLLEDFRRGRVLEIGLTVINELQMRAALLNRFDVFQLKIERKYPSLKWVFADLSNPLSKGMNEKRMQIILSPSLLFGQSAASSSIAAETFSSELGSGSKLASSLKTYLSVVTELTKLDGMEEADAKYLLDVANKQYALRPSAETVQSEQSLLELLGQAKCALRNRQLIPESGRVRQKEEQYQSLYFIRKDGGILGKFKPLPDDSLKKEMLGEAFNAILGTSFAPSANSVWLSIRKELLFIRSLLADDRFEEAMKQFNFLDEVVREEIYYLLFDLKTPTEYVDDYGTHAWHGALGDEVSNKDRVEVIDRYLNPKRSLEIILDCFNCGDAAQAMEKFRLLNFGLKHFIYYQLYLLKNPENPPNEYGEWAWNGHSDFPITNEERKTVIERCLISDGLEQFVITRDPSRFHFKGTLQTWSQRCTEGTELLYEHENAGEMMRRMPVSWVQMYNILGIIKGSGDCHSGNTLFQNDESSQFANLIDCDDEFIMPDINHIDQIQIWTLGFPQASKPLLRPIVMMLASPEFTDKWIKFIRTQFKDASDPKVIAFESRIQQINRLCKEESEKPSISLTCQDLYFEIYGGRGKFEQLKRDESHRPEFILFQYFMKDGMIQYLNEEAMSGSIFRDNVAALYL
ncbi:MAG: hypothetical protein KF898_05690 [Parachlamydiales bacterium]|nr:hypothetical protein [Candidatus Acheromyda pituitae]